MQVHAPCPGTLGMTMAAHAHPSIGAVEGEWANECVQLEHMDNNNKTISDLSKDVSSLCQV